MEESQRATSHGVAQLAGPLPRPPWVSESGMTPRPLANANVDPPAYWNQSWKGESTLTIYNWHGKTPEYSRFTVHVSPNISRLEIVISKIHTGVSKLKDIVIRHVLSNQTLPVTVNAILDRIVVSAVNPFYRAYGTGTEFVVELWPIFSKCQCPYAP